MVNNLCLRNRSGVILFDLDLKIRLQVYTYFILLPIDTLHLQRTCVYTRHGGVFVEGVSACFPDPATFAIRIIARYKTIWLTSKICVERQRKLMTFEGRRKSDVLFVGSNTSYTRTVIIDASALLKEFFVSLCRSFKIRFQ